MIKMNNQDRPHKEQPVVLFNWFPPVQTTIPSMPLSVLNTFLETHGLAGKIIYWNLLLEPLYKKYFIREEGMESGRLLPFASLLNREPHSVDVEMKIRNQLNTLAPRHKYCLQTEYPQAFEKLKSKITETIEANFSTIDFSETGLFAFSRQYHQWIPGLVFSRIIKEKHPDIKIVVGGFSSKNDSVEFMHYSALVDFAVWGEGEYPLLELTERLRSKVEDYASIAGLAYRNADNEVAVSEAKRTYVNLDGLVPDFSEYFDHPAIKPVLEKSVDHKMEILVNSIRGCIWNRCKFCVLNHGYRYREMTPEEIVRLVFNYTDTYGIEKIRFVDNDIAGQSRERFLKLLDLLFDMSVKKGKTLRIFAEIIPRNLCAEEIRKIGASGITQVQIGFEALTDGLLAKMNKQIRLADSLLFIKFALKYGIDIVGANIIRGIPGEVLQDVYESFENLHFFRFFIGKGPGRLQLSPSQLGVYPDTPFYNEIDNVNRSGWNHNSIRELIGNGSYLHINFGMSRFDYPNRYEWDKFESYYNHYENHGCHYSIIKNNETVVYKEYLVDKITNTIIFDDPVYWDVLKCANARIVNFKEIEARIKSLYPAVTDVKLKEILKGLKDEYLLYYNEDLSQVVTIIDTEMENA